MLMEEATPKMIEDWKRVWREYRGKLKPNRKNGQEIVDFLRSKYSLTELWDAAALDVVTENVLSNEPYAEKLRKGEKPIPKTFIINRAGAGEVLYENQDEIFRGNGIFVGVDLVSGFYCAEGSSLLWDELCAYRGLDKKDMENFFCVAQYIACLERFGLLEGALH